MAGMRLEFLPGGHGRTPPPPPHPSGPAACRRSVPPASEGSRDIPHGSDRLSSDTPAIPDTPPPDRLFAGFSRPPRTGERFLVQGREPFAVFTSSLLPTRVRPDDKRDRRRRNRNVGDDTCGSSNSLEGFHKSLFRQGGEASSCRGREGGDLRSATERHQRRLKGRSSSRYGPRRRPVRGPPCR